MVAIFDVGTFRDRVFLAMELIAGQPLGQWLASAPRSWAAIVEIFLSAGAGLAAAHHAGLLHRDFQLENVVLGADDRVRVLDFSLAGGYSDARSDAYAFCVALYRALYGQAPHQAGETLDQPIAPHGPGGRVPLFLRQLLQRGLAADAAARFATFDVLLTALREGRRRRRLGRGVAEAERALVPRHLCRP